MKKIEIDNVGVVFLKTRFRYFTLKEKALHLFKNKKTEQFWALKNITLDIHDGETFGILGPNGAGKSTLLKVISGVMEPDEGTISTKGRLSTLLQLGAGFKFELTGRENIYINAALLGYSENQIREKENEIIEYSGLEDFIDSPIMFYSSGMKVRLGFSIATAFRPEILVIDEVLSVGDERFKEKCYQRIREFSESNMTIVVVSHSLGTLEEICNRAMLLEKGKTVMIDKPKEVISEYLHRVGIQKKQQKSFVFNTEGYEILDFKVLNNDGEPQENFEPGDSVTFQFKYRVPKEETELHVNIKILHKAVERWRKLIIYEERKSFKINKNEGTIQFKNITPLAKAGFFSINLGILKFKQGMDFHIEKDNIANFKIKPYKKNHSKFNVTLKTEWNISQNEK